MDSICYAKLPLGFLYPVGLITGSREWFSSGTPKIVKATDRSDNCVLPEGFLRVIIVLYDPFCDGGISTGGGPAAP